MSEFTTEQYKAAIEILEAGGTKKAACEALGIKYNTTRLDKLLTEYKEQEAITAKMKKKVRGRAPTQQEAVHMIEEYLANDSIAKIAKSCYRSEAVVKNTLYKYGAMIKSNETSNPLNPAELPEECLAEEFAVGEIVWVPGYQCTGEIKKEVPSSNGFKSYRVYLLDGERKEMNVHYPCYDLGKLQHLVDIGVDVKRLGVAMNKGARDELLREALRKSRMKAGKE